MALSLFDYLRVSHPLGPVSFPEMRMKIFIIKSGDCLSVCGHSNVQMLSSPPTFKLLDSQGYLWLPYDLTEVIKSIGVTFKQ